MTESFAWYPDPYTPSTLYAVAKRLSEDWLPITVPALITQETFEAAQAQLDTFVY